MKYSKMQAIDFMLYHLENEFQHFHYTLIILWNGSLWSAQFLNREPKIFLELLSDALGPDCGEKITTVPKIKQMHDSWLGIKAYKDTFIDTNNQCSEDALFLKESNDAVKVFQILNSHYNSIKAANKLPKLIYNLVNLEKPEMTLPFAQIPENDFDWISLVIEPLG